MVQKHIKILTWAGFIPSKNQWFSGLRNHVGEALSWQSDFCLANKEMFHQAISQNDMKCIWIWAELLWRNNNKYLWPSHHTGHLDIYDSVPYSN